MALALPEQLQHKRLTKVVTHLDLTNDGSLLAVSLAAGDRASAFIEVYKVADGSLVASYGQNAYVGRGVAFIEREQNLYFLIEHAGDNHVELLRVPTAGGTPEHVADYNPDERIQALARDRDGEFLAVVGKSVEVWHTPEGQVARHRKGESSGLGVAACFSADGRYLYLYGTVESEILMHDIVENKEIKRWPAPAEQGRQVTVSPSGQYLAAVGWGARGVFVYDTTTDQQFVPEMFNENSPATHKCFTYDNSLLVGNAFVVNLETLDFLPMPTTHRGMLTAMSSAWDAPVVAFANEYGDLYWMRLKEE